MIRNRKILFLTICFLLFTSICLIPLKGEQVSSTEAINLAKTDLINYNIAISKNNLNFQLKNNQRKLNVKSKAFNLGDIIPVKYVCKNINGGKNISIPVEWSGAPEETKSFAILMYDLNSVVKNFVHWSIINIPNNISQIEEGASLTSLMPRGSIELKNTAGSLGYTGPCPPVGTGNHQYKIIVYALNDANLNLSGSVTFDQFQAAIKNKVIAQGETYGYFQQ